MSNPLDEKKKTVYSQIMKHLISLLVAAASAVSFGFDNPTYTVQYELSGFWLTTNGSSQNFLATVAGPSSATNSYSNTVPYQFVVTYTTDDDTDTPTATGQATINFTNYAGTGAFIVGTTGSASSDATCNVAACSSSRTSAGADPQFDGPVALAGVIVTGSLLDWSYDEDAGAWIGTEDIADFDCHGSATFTAANGGDDRDRASAQSTVAGNPSTGFVTGNTMSVSQ